MVGCRIVYVSFPLFLCCFYVVSKFGAELMFAIHVDVIENLVQFIVLIIFNEDNSIRARHHILCMCVLFWKMSLRFLTIILVSRFSFITLFGITFSWLFTTFNRTTESHFKNSNRYACNKQIVKIMTHILMMVECQVNRWRAKVEARLKWFFFW